MARPKRCRRIADLPGVTVFEPAGVPARSLVEIVLTVDEFEALRLADYEGLYQKQAAERMGISRPTFGRIVEAARRKVAQGAGRGRCSEDRGGRGRNAPDPVVYLRRVRSCLGPALRDWPPGRVPVLPRPRLLPDRRDRHGLPVVDDTVGEFTAERQAAILKGMTA